MNSQESKNEVSVIDVSRGELVASTVLNNTYRLENKSYLHTSLQPELSTKEEALLLDRYIYEDKGSEIARRVESASFMTRSTIPGKIMLPRVLEYGLMTDSDNGVRLAYWIDEEVEGLNAKLDRSILSMDDYRTLIDWVIMMQNETEECGTPIHMDFAARIEAFRTLLSNGYFEHILTSYDSEALKRVVDLMSQCNEEGMNPQSPVFLHGDLHVANVLKTRNDSLAIIDFEASVGGPSDNLKDIVKLLHIDYVFFDVIKSKEGGFLTNNERMMLLDYYITNSKIDQIAKLREATYLTGRVALNSFNQYVSRLTLAALQENKSDEARIRNLMRNLASVAEGVIT